jgi:hypothetical protein
MRAKIRRPKRQGGARWFYGTLAVIVAGGLVLLVLSRSETDAADIAPRPTNSTTGVTGDHWHTAFGVDICGSFLDYTAPAMNFTTVHDNPNVYAGLHSHGDGYIHEEPASLSESGNNATIGKFLDYAGFSFSDDSLDMWSGPAADPSKTTWTNGDECPPGSPFAGQEGVVKWELNCKAQKSDPNDYKLHDHDVVVFAFVPKKEDVGTPPSDDQPLTESGSGTLQFDQQKGCRTAGPGVTTTTAAGSVTTTAPTTTTTTP